MEKNNKTVKDLIWNYISLIILSLSGFVFNACIMFFYDASALGVFNQTYAWYIVLSQIAVLGIHTSVLARTSQYADDRKCAEEILTSALIETTAISIVIISAAEALLRLFFAGDASLFRSMELAFPGLLFFSVNKTILNYLNGMMRMKAYAVFQSMRYIFICVIILILSVMGTPGYMLSLSLALSELALFVIMGLYVVIFEKYRFRISKKWFGLHLKFGFQVFPSNIVVELSSRVDIICLGFILHDNYLIGIYSFAALFTDGFYQVYVVARRNINPLITGYGRQKDFNDKIKNLNAKIKSMLLKITPLAVAALAAGFYGVCMVLQKREYVQGISILLIISVSIALNGRGIIWGNILSQNEKPIYESVLNALTVMSNFALNILLISLFGMIGAAVATGLSYFVYGIVLRRLMYKKLEIRF